MKWLTALTAIFFWASSSAQIKVTATFTSIDKGFENQVMTTTCDSSPTLDFLIRNFNFPENIGSDIIWIKKDSLSNVSLDASMHYDSLNRIYRYFYQGSWISAIVPLYYVFEYFDNSTLVSQILNSDNSKFTLQYTDGRVSSILLHNAGGTFIEAVKFEYSEIKQE